jgi:uncharacterized protein (UPF0147 family)
MAKDPLSDLLDTIEFSGTSFDDLRGRQSVRATFKLTNDCIEAISILAAQLGIKQKSLFDHLFQDMETLKAIGRKVRNARLQTANRIQKTYVMSRTSLLSLEDIANHFNAPRDALIEISVQRLLPIIQKERRRHAKRKAAFSKIGTHLEQGRKLLKEAYSALGEEDPLTDRLAAAMGMYESAYKQMAGFMEKGKGIEAFEPDGFQKIDIVFEDAE